MKILVLNCGSSSVKYAVFGSKEIVRGLVECVTSHKSHKKAIEHILHVLVKDKHIASLDDVVAVGHRVVHGGYITKSVVVTKKVMRLLKHTATAAPLHNGHNIAGITAVQTLLPRLPNVAVFDTTFHNTLPRYAALYGIPLSLSKKYRIKRYGFHGISYQYICDALKKKEGNVPNRLIVCHLGNGSSVAAIKNGKSVETSMGFTPLEGLLMGTRCGDLDVGVVFHLAHMQQESRHMNHMLNYESGLKGIAGSNDMRDIWKKAQHGNKNSQLALEMYCYRVQKYIGAYAAVLNSVDAVVFTGGIGEHAWYVRERICKDLSHLGIVINKKQNKKHNTIISTGKAAVYVLPTNEEAMIWKEMKTVLRL